MNRLIIFCISVFLISCEERKEVEIRINNSSQSKDSIKKASATQTSNPLHPRSANSFNQNLKGKWKIVRYSISEHSTVEKDEAESWLNKEAEFTNNSISLNGEICEPALIESSVVFVEDFFVDEFETNADHLGIVNDKLEVFSMECDYPISDIMLLDDTTSLMASHNGLFFTLEKQP